MWKDVEVNMSEYFQMPNPGLKSMLNRIIKGQPLEYRTKFYEGKSLDDILNGWMPLIESLKREWPGLVKFENDLAKKVGPMSIMAPLSERMDDIDSYYDSISLESEPILSKAINLTKDKFGKLGGLNLRGQSNTVEGMRLSTNSGSPFYTKRRSVVNQSIPSTLHADAHKGYDVVVQELPSGSWNACAILGWRGQEGGREADDVKQRVVWMFPFAVNVSELQFYQPFIETSQLYNTVPAWVGMEAVDLAITKLFDTKRPQDLIVCTDFEKFDQHFNRALQDAAFNVYSQLVANNRDTSYWLENVFPVKYNIPLMYQWDHIRMGPHGMGSGSGGTNADESVAHTALQYEVALKHQKILNPYSMCLGDDGILSYPGIKVEDVVDSYTTHGLNMNYDKQEYSTTECTYLRRWHNINYRWDGVCVGVYSTARALGRLAEQERWFDHWNSKMVALRQLSILENIKYHPLREQFVDYCMKGDRYRLGCDIPGFLSNIDKYAREAINYMPDFLGYTKTMQGLGKAVHGISNWWIVQYLKSK